MHSVLWTAFVLAFLGLAGCRAAPSAPASDPARREFVPSRDGWSFRNSFAGDPLPEALRQSGIAPLLDRFGGRAGLAVPDKFGLCGGMSAAAADFWLQDRPLPYRASPPAEGDALYNYLRQRNADSMGAAGVMAMKFIEWMNLPETASGSGERSTGGLSVAEVQSVVERVRQDGYATVGLVYVDSRTGKPWENHQVLACRVLAADDRGAEIQVYEPNYPGNDDVKLVAAFVEGAAGKEARITQWIGDRKRHVRGLFAMPYQPVIPPDETRD